MCVSTAPLAVWTLTMRHLQTDSLGGKLTGICRQRKTANLNLSSTFGKTKEAVSTRPGSLQDQRRQSSSRVPPQEGARSVEQEYTQV